jgi:hypothetical protein
VDVDEVLLGVLVVVLLVFVVVFVATGGAGGGGTYKGSKVDITLVFGS